MHGRQLNCDHYDLTVFISNGYKTRFVMYFFYVRVDILLIFFKLYKTERTEKVMQAE